ncbi:MAG: S-layer homology domain-containing protein, partial [Peptoniphilus sp.]|nr:S-layer homology domain-containing protein [Peptoniphilus sp.]
KFSQNMFYDSNVKEVDIRNWHYSKLNGYSTAGMFYNTHKLQYIYLPAGFKDENGHDGYSTFMAADFKKQVDGEKASPIIEGSHKDYYFNADETRDTLFFVPQNLKVKVAWEDEDIPDKTRPESVEISLLANGASLKEYATMTQVEAETVTMKEENLWETTYSDLDIFHDGKKIEYSVAQAPKDIDDYITIYEPKGLVTPNKNKAGDYDIKVRNIYKTIIEQIGPDKPLTPHNFVKVTVDTTNKATYATKFNRTFWVTPNREVTIDVKEPVGKIIGGVMYEFKGWESEDGQKWEKGSKIKGTFKEETKIVAVYEEKYIPIIPQIPNPQIPDNPMGSMLLYPSTPSLETQNNEQVLNHEAYIKGYPDNSIRADGFITRAETATMIARLERFNQYDSSTPSFVDAMEGAWYNGAVNALVARNIMKGYPDGSFKADAEITRAEFAKIVSAINNKSKRTGDLPFADVRGHWAEDAITDAYLSGLIMGYPDGTFRPDQAITRAEVAKILNALYDRKSDDMSFKDIVENVNHFNDLNRSHWAYYELVEAANSHESVRRSKNEVVENWIKLVNNYK